MRFRIVLAALLVSATSGAAQSATDKPIAATLKRRFSVGGTGDMEFSPSMLFRQMVAVDGLGRLYALDRDANQVVVFNATGKRVRTLGRKGRGPGELTSPFAIGATSDGTVIVWDGNKKAFVRFGPDGKTLPEKPMRELGIVQQLLSVDTNTMVLGVTQGDSSVVLRMTGDSIERVAVMPPEPRKLVRAFDACGLSGTARAALLAPELRAAARNGAIAVSTASTFGFTLYEGVKPPRPVARDRSPEKLTTDMVRRMNGDSIPMYIGNRRCAVPMDKVMEEAGIATNMPPYSRIIFDNKGRIWAVRMNYPGVAGTSDIYSADGVYEGTVSHGKADPIAFMSDGGLVSLEKDADEAPMLVVYSVVMAQR